MEAIASSKDKVRIYQDQKEFKSDVASIMYESCKIMVNFGSGSGSAVSGSGPNLVEEMKFTLTGISKGEKRYFQAKSKAAVINVRFDTKKLDINVYGSFTQPYPSETSNDGKKNCKAGQECVLVLKVSSDNKALIMCLKAKGRSCFPSLEQLFALLEKNIRSIKKSLVVKNIRQIFYELLDCCGPMSPLLVGFVVSYLNLVNSSR